MVRLFFIFFYFMLKFSLSLSLFFFSLLFWSRPIWVLYFFYVLWYLIVWEFWFLNNGVFVNKPFNYFDFIVIVFLQFLCSSYLFYCFDQDPFEFFVFFYVLWCLMVWDFWFVNNGVLFVFVHSFLFFFIKNYFFIFHLGG